MGIKVPRKRNSSGGQNLDEIHGKDPCKFFDYQEFLCTGGFVEAF